MRCIDGGSVDLIVTDPPFAIGFKARRANYNRVPGNVIGGYGEVSQKDYLPFSKRWISEAYRVLKESGSMFVFSGWSNLKDVMIALDDAGFTFKIHLNHDNCKCEHPNRRLPSHKKARIGLIITMPESRRF